MATKNTAKQQEAAEQITEATEAVAEVVDAQAAQLAATQQELAESLTANETMAREIEELKAKVAEGGATCERLRGRVADLEADLQAAAHATVTRQLPDDDTLHARWIAAGGKHSEFEAAKRFAQQMV